jgi:hypothetical protein
MMEDNESKDRFGVPSVGFSSGGHHTTPQSDSDEDINDTVFSVEEAYAAVSLGEKSGDANIDAGPKPNDNETKNASTIDISDYYVDIDGGALH